MNFFQKWKQRIKQFIRSLFSMQSTERLPKINKITYKRKKSDMTKFTQYTYDYIIYMYTTMHTYNGTHPNSKITIERLCTAINETMGTHKSRTTIAKVWQGKINRDELEVGEAYFTY